MPAESVTATSAYGPAGLNFVADMVEHVARSRLAIIALESLRSTE
jgi:hypothetical protein